MEGKKRKYKKRSRAYWQSEQPKLKALKARQAYEARVLMEAIKPLPKDQPLRSNIPALTAIICLTILGVTALIGVFFGRQGLITAGVGVLFFVAAAIIFIADRV